MTGGVDQFGSLRILRTNQFGEHSSPGCDDGMHQGIQKDCGLHQDGKNARLRVPRKREFEASVNLFVDKYG
jgi:hypothetical protein